MPFWKKRTEAEPAVGYDVVTSDEQHVGAVTAVDDDAIEVTGGSIDHHMMWRVPRSAIARVEAESVYLAASHGQMRTKGWEQPAESAGGEVISHNA